MAEYSSDNVKDLPTGTVSFLFTDIEGSTKLAQDYPDEMPALLARHNEILENAIKAQNGFVFNIVGDSYHASFQSAEQALNAALEAQRNLTKEAWSPAPVKARMGIHTGNATLEDPKGSSPYKGYATLALTSRVMSAGHGGQILLTQDSFALVDQKIPDVSLKNMGEHNLKDVNRPQQLYQVMAGDLPAEFPPLKTQKTINHNLPLNLTSFIGRDKEINEVKAAIENTRLLTLIGPGGTGKTRLSIQVGNEFITTMPHGVWMVELAPISDPALIPQTVAMVFGLRESPGLPIAEQINDYLRAKQLLLILDNCEHLVEGSADFANGILKGCPQIKILASSREALGVPNESTYRVPSLGLPDKKDISLDKVSKFESVQLFTERAKAANPNFELNTKNASAIAQICRRLDGIPLALELAAARAKVLSVEQIAERLDDRFRLLTGGSRTALPRQQTLRALIDWSYGLLSEPEKALFRRLAVFEGGWTLEAAEKVCSGNGVDEYDVLDLLTQLVDKSLVITEEKDGSVRYGRLETIRQYAREKLLETEESIVVRSKHLEYYISLGTRLDKVYISPFQHDMIQQMAPEYDNIRSALSWSVEKDIEKATNLLSITVVFWSWVLLGNTTEVGEWSKLVLDKLEEKGKNEPSELITKLRGQMLNRYSQVLMNIGDHKAACRAAEESIEIARKLNDQKTLANALGSLAHCSVYAGNPEKAQTAAQEGIKLSEEIGELHEQVWALDAMTHYHSIYGGDDEVYRYYEIINGVLRSQNIPNDPVYDGGFKVEQALKKGKFAEAEKIIDSLMFIILERKDNYTLATMQSMFAHALRQIGDLERAEFHYRKTILLWQDRGHRAAMAHQLECFAFIALVQEDPERAAKLLATAETIRNAINSVRTPPEQKEFEDAVAQLRSGMEAAEFEKAWEEGKSMSLENAVSYVLDEVE